MAGYSYTGKPQFVVLNPGTYDIVAYGAQGGNGPAGNGTGGAGAEVGGEFQFTQATTLELIVGGQGAPGGRLSGGGGGGGGGGFVLQEITGVGSPTQYLPVLIAGGGGGCSFDNGGSGTVGPQGTGSGGPSPSLGGGGGGAGVRSAGASDGGGGGGYNGTGRYAGGAGNGVDGSRGGFGGGGGGSVFFGGGGGGGYSGGFGGNAQIVDSAGGGGTSFDSGTPIAADTLAGENTGNGRIVITEICYLRGTRILTPDGERRIDDLRIGHRVVTRFGGVQTIAWIGRQSFDPRFVRNNTITGPVRIRAGALGGDLPTRDLYVSAGHSVLLRRTLVLARNLVNGVTVTRECPPNTDVLEYYQLDLDGHDCVVAEGCWSETFADGPGLRDAFHNVAEYRWMHPDRPDAGTLVLCAPRPERGPALDAALRPVVARAAVTVAPGPLDGFVDIATPTRIEGWARDRSNPDLPVLLEFCAGDAVIGTVLACDHRADLVHAGKGGGYCAFRFTPPVPLDPAALTVRRAADGSALASTTACRAAA